MDSDGLPLVGPGIDYNKVEAINQKRTVAFINHFVTHTSRFLNHFSNVCEDKLELLTGRLQQLEISLSILEAKLSSIPGLESVTVATAASATTQDAPMTNNVVSPPSQVIATPVTAPTPDQVQNEVPPAPEETKPLNPVSQDPRYIKYFKMLQYGVPAPVVKGKMGMEGLNPDLLDTPDAPVPDGGSSGKKQDNSSGSDSEASFSD